jgi:hypothetical protein
MSNRKPKLLAIKSQQNKKEHYANDEKLKHRNVGYKSIALSLTFATWVKLQLTCITTNKGQYYTIILFKGSNMDIQLDLTSFEILFPFVCARF